jgi:hypothetical protein
MVFQDPDDQLFMPTVYDDVAFGPLNLGLPLKEVEERVDRALSTVEALHLKHRPPYKLSRGEKRSVAIATVLSMAPDILVMDEPTSDLDPKARRHLIELLKTFRHTKIIATHDLDYRDLQWPSHGRRTHRRNLPKRGVACPKPSGKTPPDARVSCLRKKQNGVSGSARVVSQSWLYKMLSFRAKRVIQCGALSRTQ